MMKFRSVLLSVIILFSFSLAAQNIKGIVLDALTNQPIESAAVYFDNTSIGTSTNDKGEFEIAQREGITSALVISFLGYEKIVLDTYKSNEYYKILMKESLDSLDEVVISTNDGMPRHIKLEQFRKQFLGFSKLSESCTILNEEAIIINYEKSAKELTASAKAPVIIKNESLKYTIHFEIHSFLIQYSLADVKEKHFHVKEVVYTGTTFYESYAKIDDKKTFKRREKAYEGSVLHFMRALYQDNIEEEGFEIYSGGFKVIPSNYIYHRELEDNLGFVNISLLKELDVLYKRKRQSAMRTRDKDFIIDPYGNFSPLAILLGGDMGNQRVGDLLPFDYKLSENK